MKETGQSKNYVLWKLSLCEINMMLKDQPRTLEPDDNGDNPEAEELTDDNFEDFF